MHNDNPQHLIDRLRRDLLDARRTRNQLTTTTLQGVLSSVDNAGAVSVPENINFIGTGSTDVSRRELSLQDIRELVSGEITEAQNAIKELGDKEGAYVDELNERIAILENYL
ncbi:MAG: hypothetical protein JWP06_853 [Candidatus Saccharibacteria bacterium]|nr:hypothetical protein [Candidatus Saccharibacteria bacterium]